VDNSTGHSHVTIKGGTIRQFDLGVGVAGGDGSAAGNHIHHLAVAHTTSFGIVAIDTTRTVVSHNVVRDPGISAVLVLGSANALVASNLASGSTETAMFLDGDSNSRIVQNRVTASEDGIAVGGSHNLVRGNVVTDSLGSIDVPDGATSTTVEFNRLSRVGDGVIVGVASGTVVEHNVINRTGGDDRGGFGIILDGSIRTTVKHNIVRATGPGPGIYVAHLDAPTPPRNNRVIRNVTTSKNADGILVDPDAAGTVLLRNLAVHSGDDGIDVRAPGTAVTRNIANANHDLGISAVRGVIDGGGTGRPGTATPPSAPTSPASNSDPPCDPPGNGSACESTH
jgi:parallel beta-helix repeat protein